MRSSCVNLIIFVTIMAEHNAIVKYNGILARRSKERTIKAAAAAPRQPRWSPLLRSRPILDITFPVPQMPKSIKQLMFHGIPIGSRRMTHAITGEEYYKYNGLKEESAHCIAEYLLSISAPDRKEIWESMLATSRIESLKKFCHFLPSPVE